MSMPNVFIALLIKQKSAVLPLFLETLEAYDYPKDNIFLYIRTNNNTDNTEEILEAWIQENANRYRGLIYDKNNVSENIERFGVHEWNGERFRVLGRIRQEVYASVLRLTRTTTSSLTSTTSCCLRR